MRPLSSRSARWSALLLSRPVFCCCLYFNIVFSYWIVLATMVIYSNGLGFRKLRIQHLEPVTLVTTCKSSLPLLKISILARTCGMFLETSNLSSASKTLSCRLRGLSPRMILSGTSGKLLISPVPRSLLGTPESDCFSRQGLCSILCQSEILQHCVGFCFSACLYPLGFQYRSLFFICSALFEFS